MYYEYPKGYEINSRAKRMNFLTLNHMNTDRIKIETGRIHNRNIPKIQILKYELNRCILESYNGTIS